MSGVPRWGSWLLGSPNWTGNRAYIEIGSGARRRHATQGPGIESLWCYEWVSQGKSTPQGPTWCDALSLPALGFLWILITGCSWRKVVLSSSTFSHRGSTLAFLLFKARLTSTSYPPNSINSFYCEARAAVIYLRAPNHFDSNTNFNYKPCQKNISFSISSNSQV